jgi:hypothetical protein
MHYRWVALAGEFELGETIIFKGKKIEIGALPAQTATESLPEESSVRPATAPALGVALCDQRFSDGKISATIEFVDEIDESGGCELVLAYDVETNKQVSAGIPGANWAMYSIREWLSGSSNEGRGEVPHWAPYAVGGDRANLKVGRVYQIEARIFGSRVTLHLDGVHVASATLPSSWHRAQQVGVWCMSTGQIKISNFLVESAKPRAFVVMQFSEAYDQVYSEVIREVCKGYRVEVVRADEMCGPGVIISDIVEQIETSSLIIADVTPQNTNVYFEVGYALALNKPIVLLARRGTQIPFDLAAFRVLFYEDSIGGKAKLEEGLRRHIGAILGEEFEGVQE